MMTGCNNNDTADNKHPTELSDLYPKLGKPQPGEWLYEHNEQGQTFAEFKQQTPISAIISNGKLYLLPLGVVNKDLIAALRDYLQAVYASIMFKDVIPRLNTADVNSLERVAKYLASVTGSPISINKIKIAFYRDSAVVRCPVDFD